MQRALITTSLSLTLLALVGCGGDDSSPPEVATANDPAPGVGELVFHDELDDDGSGWGDVDGAGTYLDRDFVWAFTGQDLRPHAAPADLQEQVDEGTNLRDVVVRAEGSASEGTALGVFCRETEVDGVRRWYEFVARDGFAAIRRADDQGHLDVLVETDELSVPAGETTALEAACVDEDAGAHLWLTVGGAPVLQIIDRDPLSSGLAGLQAYADEDGEATVRWEEFSVTRPDAGEPGSVEGYCELTGTIFAGADFPTDAELEAWSNVAPPELADLVVPLADLMQDEGLGAIDPETIDPRFDQLTEAETEVCGGDVFS
jgi:hypothetical protein